MSGRGSAQAERIARVLDPEFVDGLGGLSVEELRARRDEARDEREYRSFLRRLVQVRQDLVDSERARRAAGTEPGPLLERLTTALSVGPAGPSRGEAVRVHLPAEDLAEAEVHVTAVVGSADLSALEHMDDGELERLRAVLATEEERVSADRSAVIRVHDLLQEELKRRYRRDPSLIPQGV